MKDFEKLLADEELNKLIDSINEINKDTLQACHGRYHTMFVVGMVEEILTKLQVPERKIELGKIAGLLHDIGISKGKKGHAKKSQDLAIPFLEKTNLTEEEKTEVLHAIEDHSNGDDLQSPIGAALLLADKINLSKDRVLEKGKEDKWHCNLLEINEVRFDLTETEMIIEYVKTPKFSQEILFSDWKKGFTVPIKVAKYFNRTCVFKVNGEEINQDKMM